ncbi:hypothetical protein CCR75_003938 [Bremia lactucae]|uniref:Aspartyl/asparaginy/proline hydroxylase domain-containing protein n=1 Tax=Bremia lactucae TaxID=4779 RepID=A0A976FMN3_BRELC|nr:hypothetical protein CCR75_003938 [Bremia lactucae]
MVFDEHVEAKKVSESSVCDFYDRVFRSPIYAEHHRVCCNVGFHSSEGTYIDPSTAAITAASDSADSYIQLHQGDRCQLELYKKLLDIDGKHEERRDKELTIIDIGCGAGGGLCELQTLYPNAEIMGLDISSQALERSKEVWKRFSEHLPKNRAKPLRLYHHSCERMKSLLPESVDVAVAVQSIQEMPNLETAATEILRVLKPGGLLFIADYIPPNVAADHLIQSFVSPNSSTRTNELPYEVLQEQRVTNQAVKSSELSSSALRDLIYKFTPPIRHSELETLFFIQNSRLYNLLHRGEIEYHFVCLRKTKACNIPEEQISQDEKDESEEAIQDDDMPNYYPYRDLFPQLDLLKHNYHVILEEMEAVQQMTTWPFWPEKHYTDGNNEWRVFPFCYTFPASDASKITWVPRTCSMCPRTTELLKKVPHIRTALFSKLGPDTTLSAHRGWADLANYVLRVHFPLVVPTLSNGDPCCAMVVSGETTYHQERKFIVFDDSKLHYAFNHHPDATRLVLIIDLYRPDHLPRGRARGGHSDELDAFIESFGKQTLLKSNEER